MKPIAATLFRDATLTLVALTLLAQHVQAQSAEVTGGVTIVGQSTNDERIRNEVVASLDLFLSLALGRITLETYVEGNTTPSPLGVSRLLGEANTDAGTALDRDRRGRVQLSEVRLVVPVGDDLRAHAGLLDATGFLDVSRIANDENLYFLAVPFVNNPTIEFPDYALGVALDGAIPGSSTLRVGATVTSSHGLADNPGVSYARLLDITDSQKGAFLGMALRRVGARTRISLGAWMRTVTEPDPGEPAEAGRHRGLFSVLGWHGAEHAVSFRSGISNDRVSLGRAFLGGTYLWTRRPDAVGLAVGHTFGSSQLPDLADVTHAEVFARRRLVRDVFATASIQRLINSGFDPTGTTYGARLWVLGLRLSAQF